MAINTQSELVSKFGNPMTADRTQFEAKWMTIVDLTAYDRVIEALPTKIYMNKLVEAPFKSVLEGLIAANLHTEVKTYDGCFNVRFQRGSTNKLSRHSWGLAFDFNAAWNPLVKVKTPPGRDAIRKQYVKWTEPFLQIWRDNGFSCGSDWTYSIDGMHFEYPIFNI
jgi:D-alanyl-D-alanine carboxypeptidase